MAKRGSEQRRLQDIVSFRLDADLALLLETELARVGLGASELMRNVLRQHLTGGQPVNVASRKRLLVSDEDRRVIGMFSRTAGLLAGALTQAAKTARTSGRTADHLALERVLSEVRDAKAAVLRLQESIR